MARYYQIEYDAERKIFSWQEDVDKKVIAKLPAPLDAEQVWLNAAEAAQCLNFKVRTIHLWARQAKLKAYALTDTQRRVWRFLQSDLDTIVMHKKPVLSSAQLSVLAGERR